MASGRPHRRQRCWCQPRQPTHCTSRERTRSARLTLRRGFTRTMDWPWREAACAQDLRDAGLGSGTSSRWRWHGRSQRFMESTPPHRRWRAPWGARRSAVGTWTFAGGGLVVEGGRRADRDECGPLLARLPFPPSWRCVVVVPDGTSGLSGESEAAAFDRLAAPPEHEVERVAHLVLMSLLPALADADIEAFGTALTAIQEMTGRWFAPVQGGTFAPGLSEELVRRMSEWGASGVGQSSWGPAVYGVVADRDTAERLADRVRALLRPAGTVYEARSRQGARVWWGQKKPE